MVTLNQLTAIGPVDGRYWDKVKELSDFASEYAIIQYRVRIEMEYLEKLAWCDVITLDAEQTGLLHTAMAVSPEQAQVIKDIEVKGYPGINQGRKTNHDVKSIEYYLRHAYAGTPLERVLEQAFHLALTSEDVNNIAYALMVKDAVEKVVMPSMMKLEEKILDAAERYKNIPMLGRTHGQPAVPTTVGKEFVNFGYRIAKELHELKQVKLPGKLNGAVGNWNAHYAAYPGMDWIGFSEEFVEDLGLEPNLITTQIEPHDGFAGLFQNISRINTILIGFDQDMWRYVSDDTFKQRPKEGEVGSSTMPQKVNPIDFENSEGNLGLANALFQYFAAKLPVSRLQRDLSDSTVQRNFGMALAYALIGYKSAAGGLDKIEVNAEKLAQELDAHWEVLAEPFQIILKREGVGSAYEKLKERTRGRVMGKQDIDAFIDEVEVKEKVKEELRRLTPHTYLGQASQLSTMAVAASRKLLL